MWTAKFKIRFTGDVKMKLKHEGVLFKDRLVCWLFGEVLTEESSLQFSTLRFSLSLDQIIIRLCLISQINIIEKTVEPAGPIDDL